MHAALVVADDLTGATDTAHGFAARGYGTRVRIDGGGGNGDGERDGGVPVLSVTTESRYDDAESAAAAVDRAVRASTARLVYKKVDSTLRGNVASEVEAALARTGAQLALVAPAFPAAGRTTEGGVHAVDGTPVDESEYAADANGPATAALTDLFAPVGPVTHVSLSAVEEGADAVAARVGAALDATDGPPVVVCDATDADHLAAVAAAGARFDPLYVGSGGLAAHVAPPDAERGAVTPPPVPAGAPLAVAGSVNPATLEQLARVPDEQVVELDATALIAGESHGERVGESDVERVDEGETDRAGTRAAERLRAGEPAVLTAATDRAAVDRTLAAGKRAGLDPAAVRERVAAGLARSAGRALAGDPSGLVLTGGDLAVAAARELDATAIDLSGAAVADGVPLGRFADGAAAGTPVVTKAGGFGGPSAIVNCLDRLRDTNV
ncbi:MAG: four-carbon acid sugar kinase family protein [Haloarculaceae archaeon]